MENWEYSFDPVSKVEWIAQIERDLKGKSIDSLNKEWWQGEPLIPIHHIDDSVSPPIILPDALFRSPPKVIEFIEASFLSSQELNKRILEALQYGTQVIHIGGKPTDGVEIDIILKDVIPNIIEWHIEDISMLHAFTLWDPNNTYLCELVQDNSHVSLHDLQRFINEIQPAQLRLNYFFFSSDDFLASTTGIFQNIIGDLDKWKQQDDRDCSWFFECVQLELVADVDYFKSIIQMRVLHLIWQNMRIHFTGKDITRQDYLTLYIAQQEEIPDHFLIRASMSALAGCLSGAGGICIHKQDRSEEPDFYRRIARNIHHLLNLESGLPKGRDPLAGAYTIDYYTRLWSERIWNNLSLE